MAERQLVTLEVRFTTEDDPDQLADRVRESLALIVGRGALEDFRMRAMPLTPPKRPGAT